MTALDGGYDDMRRAYDLSRTKVAKCHVIMLDRPGMEHPLFVQGRDSEGDVVWGPSATAVHFDSYASAMAALVVVDRLRTDLDVQVAESYMLPHMSRGLVSTEVGKELEALPEIEIFG
ncbi:MAG: hypothetical protein JSV86_06575 [Gemmatimonadota bacterium]|nr:MAG: hypothetical protein JSV86_06575 [Gemmatimonadota bacterium]